MKEWISVEDARTRSFAGDDAYDHAAMNGQKREMDQPFLMPQRGGDPIPCDRPGDPTLPPGAVINCRCATTFRVKGF